MDKNLENKIKHHFENRRINPEAKAWSKLDSALSQSEKKAPLFYRLNIKVSVAAVALIIFGLFLLNHYFMPIEKAEIITANMSEELKTEIGSPSETSNEQFQIIDDTENKIKKPLKIRAASSTSSIMVINTHAEEINQNQVSASNKTEEPKYKVPQHDKTNQEVTPINQKEEYNGFTMVDPEKLLSDTEIALTLKSRQDIINKYEIDPTKLLFEAEKEVNRGFLQKALKSVKEISTPMISAVMTRNEISVD